MLVIGVYLFSVLWCGMIVTSNSCDGVWHCKYNQVFVSVSRNQTGRTELFFPSCCSFYKLKLIQPLFRHHRQSFTQSVKLQCTSRLLSVQTPNTVHNVCYEEFPVRENGLVRKQFYKRKPFSISVCCNQMFYTVHATFLSIPGETLLSLFEVFSIWPIIKND